jgi:hypothetical protein
MTAPVVTRIGAAAGPFCKNNFTIAFFVPFAFQVSCCCCSAAGVALLLVVTAAAASLLLRLLWWC